MKKGGYLFPIIKKIFENLEDDKIVDNQSKEE